MKLKKQPITDEVKSIFDNLLTDAKKTREQIYHQVSDDMAKKCSPLRKPFNKE